MLSAAIVLSALSCEDESTEATSSAIGGAPPDGGTTSTAPSGGAGGALIIEADCQEGWCRIPAGTFVIGSPVDECGHPPFSETQASVTLTRSFLIGQHEVTQAEWEAHGLVNPSYEITNNPDDKGNCMAPDCPVGNVNWFEAVAFSNLLSAAEGLPACYELSGCGGNVGEGMECTDLALTAPTVYDCAGYRLPTEAEWEYAARAGSSTPIYSGALQQPCELSLCYPDANLDAIAWFCGNSGAQSQPVGQREPNGWGLYDVHGNILEWTHSVFTSAGYGDGPLVDFGGDPGPVTPTTARSMRGCPYIGWNSLCRAAKRFSTPIGGNGASRGFRLARTAGD